MAALGLSTDGPGFYQGESGRKMTDGAIEFDRQMHIERQGKFHSGMLRQLFGRVFGAL